MQSLIITKWIEPYKLLETIKEDYQYKDFTFDGSNKLIEKKKFIKELNNSKFSLGLYMKNVNKYYLFTRNESFDILTKLEHIFELTQEDIQICDEDINKPFDLVDIGKAEAGIIIP